MKPLIAFLIFSLMLVEGVYAGPNHYFYRVRNGDKVSYILGTIHSGVPVNSLPVGILRALKGSRFLVTEISISKREAKLAIQNPAKFYVKMRNSNRTEKNGTPLSEAAKRSLVEDLHISKDVVEKSFDSECGILKFNEEGLRNSMDYNLALLASENRVSNYSLESISELKEKSATSIDHQNSCSLSTMLHNGEAKMARDQFLQAGETLSRLYRTGELSNFLNSDLVPNAALRNRKWLPKITSFFETDRTFLAVGAAHLYGEAGLLKLLKAKGYKITQLQYGIR